LKISAKAVLGYFASLVLFASGAYSGASNPQGLSADSFTSLLPEDL